MADFARIKEQDRWINLDYVVRVEPDADEAGSTVVIFADGTSFAISNADGKRLLKRFRPQKKKKKKKKPAAPESAAPDDQPAPVGEGGF